MGEHSAACAWASGKASMGARIWQIEVDMGRISLAATAAICDR